MIDAHTKWSVTKRPNLETAHHETAQAQKSHAQNGPSSKQPQDTKRPEAHKTLHIYF
jgi:hypothetical protein